MCGTNTTTNNNPASRLLLSAVGVVVALAGLYAGPATAQGIVLDEVIVTAQKREQTLEDVPASVSAISGETVRDLLGAAENIRALTNRVPSLNVESSNGRTQPRFYLRGLGNIDFDNNAAQPVGMVFDDIFLESNVLRSLPLFDIQRVEVLKGPQGSLFGRNTNAGLVKIDSVKPSDDRDAYVSLAYGDHDTVAFEAATNVQASENVDMRGSVKYQRRSNWIDNIANGSGNDYGEFDELGYRLQFLYDAGGTFSGLLKLHGFHQEGTQPQVFYANGLEVGSKGVRSGFDETQANHDSAAGAGMELDHFGVMLNLEWDLESFTITSITGVDELENFQFTDVDGGVSTFDDNDIGRLGFSTFPVATGDGLDDHTQFTQEIRLSTETENMFFQGGIFVLNEDMIIRSQDFANGFTDFVDQRTDSFAVFGQVELMATDSFSIVAGARFTFDEKDLFVIPGPNSSAVADSINVQDDYLSWDLAFVFDISEDWSLYGRLANASRGPVTIGRFGFVSSAETETSDSIEFGFKSTLFGGRGRWNLSAYSFNVDDQQLSATGGGANVNRLLNADGVKGNGFETDFEILFTDNLLFIANASYNNTEIDDPDLNDLACGSAPSCTKLDPILVVGGGPFGEDVVAIDGNPLPRAPEWMYNLILQWNLPVGEGDFYIHTDWNYRDDSNLFLHESVEFVADSRWLGGLRIGYRSDNGLDVALVGRNITDEISVDGGINFNNLTIFINEPAFWGVEVRKDW
ncbi:MAG: TonB-dependent receptor [Woeseiaceae bacterium]|nr:TonB-dependent receptor [Woeseiaceae bacterium]NIP21887.1 TonB-dependent receptor [Woeseiaceae bacterium]NIS90972.1 TonB-dependent receptor [Woeseiaceae bacterium]